MLEKHEVYRCKDPIPLVYIEETTLWQRIRPFFEKHEKKARNIALIIVAGEIFYICQRIGGTLAEHVSNHSLSLLHFFPH